MLFAEAIIRNTACGRSSAVQLRALFRSLPLRCPLAFTARTKYGPLQPPPVNALQPQRHASRAATYPIPPKIQADVCVKDR